VSIEYCNFCDQHIDTDFHAEHFDTKHKECECIMEEDQKHPLIIEDEEQWLEGLEKQLNEDFNVDMTPK